MIAVRLDTCEGALPLLARFVYSADHPYAVQADFFDGQTSLASWQFDRQMLAEGLRRPVGEGDVTFGPHEEVGGREFRIGLRNHADGAAGRAVLFADGGMVKEFLDRTYAVVGEGEEFLDLDKLLDEFLAR
ncbi:SsgA family sporulation/cell division regulator [Streptomyces sp. NPDC051109]|uniref:SsgA family sporulation/cell division regulator n=1 Tax=Streptomyces sp. NPDC051109 TaxID=3365642 RepID=UPI001416F456